MIESGFDRRDFLKVLGWGGTAVALSGCGNTSVQDGKETVVSYVEASDYMIPGVSVRFNSTCTQCEAGCSINGRVREGRVLKLEGNPDSDINRGKMCGLGQAGVQHHYNPDRLKEPMLLNGDQSQSVSWEAALKLINDKLQGVSGDQIAFLTGTVSGHVKALLGNFMESVGSKHHFAYEALSSAVLRAANKKSYGVEMPRYSLDKAKVVVSFGADFLGAWVSPVHFSQQYSRFRKGVDGQRGVLVQIESKMTLTGANADRWLAIRPGTEGVLALGLINALGAAGLSLPAEVAAEVKAYDKARVSKETGVAVGHIDKLVALLRTRTPSLVLAGNGPDGFAQGSENVAAINLLNQVLGNVGKTVEAPVSAPFAQLQATNGDSASLYKLNEGMARGQYKVLFACGTNPVFSAPASLKVAENIKRVGFKVAFAHYLDETAQQADLVLPLDSSLEDWGTHIVAYQPGEAHIGIQQPLMEKLHANTRGAGDILLALLKSRRAEEYKAFEDYYAYLRAAVLQNKAALGGGALDDEGFWEQTLSKGLIRVAGSSAALSTSTVVAAVPVATAENPDYPLTLIPGITPNLRDGRYANQPWLQESPDPLTTIVWDSWVEIHPKKAAELGIAEGDIVEVISRTGSIKAQAYLFPGIHPEAVSVPLGRGQNWGRYAKGFGVNPFQILDPVFDKQTGELALNDTRVKIKKSGKRVIVIKDEGAAGGKQMGKKIAVRASTDEVDLSKEV